MISIFFVLVLLQLLECKRTYCNFDGKAPKLPGSRATTNAPLVCHEVESDTAPLPPHLVSGSYRDEIEKNGWSWLEINTNASFSDHEQAYGAGYLEGKLTAQRIYEYSHNTGIVFSEGPRQLQEYVNKNLAWMKEMIAKHPSDLYWISIDLMLKQLHGIASGYNHNYHKDRHIPFADFLALQMQGDLDDLCVIFGCDDMAVPKRGNSHCSVLIKLLPDDVIAGHTTWSVYESMTRVYKKYSIPYRHNPGRVISFSSYPAMISSLDDWYQINTGLVVTETTIANNNASLWKNVKHDQVLNWYRSMVANRLAKDGKEWMHIYEKHNSGTYNNQWMVVDYNRFSPSSGPSAGFLWVGEQLPGHFYFEEQTEFLKQHSYWISYNRPFYPYIFNLSNQWELVEKYGDHFSWEKTARSVLFRGMQANVVNRSAYERVLRWNDYTKDPIGTQGCKHGTRSASNAISERGDLTTGDCISDIAQINEGGTDAKYTTYKGMINAARRLETTLQSGPTHDLVPPFRWSNSPFKHVAHIGQPDLFAFPWVNVSFTY